MENIQKMFSKIYSYRFLGENKKDLENIDDFIVKVREDRSVINKAESDVSLGNVCV